MFLIDVNVKMVFWKKVLFGYDHLLNLRTNVLLLGHMYAAAGAALEVCAGFLTMLCHRRKARRKFEMRAGI